MKQNVDFKKRMREIKFTTEHTLTPDQFQKRLEEKVKRVEQYQRAYKMQEMLVRNHK